MPAIGCLMTAHGTISKTRGLDKLHGTAAHSHPFGEMPLHTMAKGAVFLPLGRFSKKSLQPHGVASFSFWQQKDRIFCHIFLHVFRIFSHILILRFIAYPPPNRPRVNAGKCRHRGSERGTEGGREGGTHECRGREDG